MPWKEMKGKTKKVLLIEPSAMLAKGLKSVFSDLGEFELSCVLQDLSRSSEAIIRSTDADVIVVDPIVFDYSSRPGGRNYISEFSDAAVVALRSVTMDEDAFRQYDEVIGLYDDPAAIVRRLRSALHVHGDTPKSEGEELSVREKEILVCVAKGMLNKEIADMYNISIYTVITHRKNITRKTGIKTVAGLTVYALLNNLLDINAFE